MAWCCNCNGKLVWQRQKGPSVWHMELSYLSWKYFRWNSCRYYIRIVLQLLILEAHKMQSYLTSFHTKKILEGKTVLPSHRLSYYTKFQGFSLKMIGLIPSLYPEVSLPLVGSSFGSFLSLDPRTLIFQAIYQ